MSQTSRPSRSRRPNRSGMAALRVTVTVTAGAAALLLGSAHWAGRVDRVSHGAPLAWSVMPPTGDAVSALSRSQALRAAGLAGFSSAALATSWVQPADASPVRGDTLKLNNGLAFPKASFGLQIYDDATAQKLTETAISVGFRNFFASVLANNQRGFAKGVAASGIDRKELFICGSVVSNRARNFEEAYQFTKRGCEENLRAFAVGGITYVDQMMLDYPAGSCESIRGQWKAFEEMLAAGQTKSLAVSNFSPEELDCILADKTATVPTVNQLPYSVGKFDSKAVEENRKRGIVVQAWSPLASVGKFGQRKMAVLKELGEKYGKSPVQVALRWIVDTGATFSTQTRKKEHFEEDLNVFDFQLTKDEVERISTTTEGGFIS
ncbi:unnamed protein product [Polarella glacialis]|uniref:NADP-dependent oxidoreductase domain-containing protein n=1 Tax=Polarella glacialis TaxID=89957 RepID=A0A813DT55_POLGL|nr:unnamed protein product [Polarella glacialis]